MCCDVKLILILFWIIINQKINKEEVKLQRKLYQKLTESSVRPSSNLGASSQKTYWLLKLCHFLQWYHCLLNYWSYLSGRQFSCFCRNFENYAKFIYFFFFFENANFTRIRHYHYKYVSLHPYFLNFVCLYFCLFLPLSVCTFVCLYMLSVCTSVCL